MFPRGENRNEGTFGCSPGTKTGTRVRSHVPKERKLERGYVCQNHPLTKRPFLSPSAIRQRSTFRSYEEQPIPRMLCTPCSLLHEACTSESRSKCTSEERAQQNKASQCSEGERGANGVRARLPGIATTCTNSLSLPRSSLRFLEAPKPTQIPQIHAVSGLTQGHFLENDFHPLKLGLKWGFVNVRSGYKSGFWCIFTQAWTQKTHFSPTFGPISGDWQKPILDPLSAELNSSPNKGAEAALTQHNPRHNKKNAFTRTFSKSSGELLPSLGDAPEQFKSRYV